MQLRSRSGVTRNYLQGVSRSLLLAEGNALSRWSRIRRELTNGTVESLMPGLDPLERASLAGIDPRDRVFSFNGNQYYGYPAAMPDKTERIEPGFLGVTIGGMKKKSVNFQIMSYRNVFFFVLR